MKRVCKGNPRERKGFGDAHAVFASEVRYFFLERDIGEHFNLSDVQKRQNPQFWYKLEQQFLDCSISSPFAIHHLLSYAQKMIRTIILIHTFKTL
jgi:hypothetical protein